MEKFYLGLDIGTDSVGIACTDENYKLLRAKGQDLWAVRLFEEAKDAKERRTKRTARRRLQRRAQRIEFLQQVFGPYLGDSTDDDFFFMRMSNSGFEMEDKHECCTDKYSLFSDMGYTDADFYREYPTVYHLRKALLEPSDKPRDVRLFYLACHHIVKYRGHFLNEGEEMQAATDVKKLLSEFNVEAEEAGLELRLEEDRADSLRDLFMDGKKSLNDKKKKAEKLFATGKDKAMKILCDLLVGASVKAQEIFGEEFAKEHKEEKSVSFKGLSDESFAALQEIYGDYFPVLEKLRAVYQTLSFTKVMNGKNYVSDAMIEIYKKHGADLRTLKDFIKSNAPDLKRRIFRLVDDKANNYVNYVGYTIKKGNKISVKKCKDKEFFDFLKKELVALKGKVADEETRVKILQEIENETFLPRILHADNGLFPHQVNLLELDKILENLCMEHPYFAEADDDGITRKEKIRKIFLFKIPYYVGPLNPQSPHAWLKRTAERITPWNFDRVVDKEESGKEFIVRMTNKCSYLHDEDVLPKQSLIYQKYDVLNQLNKLKINEVAISVDLKKELFDELYAKNKKVTEKMIRTYLVKTGKLTKEESEKTTISGFDGELKANLTSYHLLKNKLGDWVDAHPDACEQIIFWHTVHTDKTIVEKLIEDNYGADPVIKENIKYLKGITAFKDFGRLSKKLLTGLVGYVDEVTGEAYTILDRLYETNENLNQILNNEQYSFQAKIDEENGKYTGKEQLDAYLEESYLSPAVKRGVRQSLKMVEEYVSAVGRAPDKIFVEVTRKHEPEKGRTKSRREQLLALYETEADLESFQADLDRCREKLRNVDNRELNSERLYLYYQQLGRCAYTGQIIDLGTLGTEMYDVDHIMPQSKIKDDSLDNKVLVVRAKNLQKTNDYPLPTGFTDQQRFWKLLKNKGLMSGKKYNLLTRTEPLTEDDFNNFIARQLVFTNQSAKATIEILKNIYGEKTKIVYSKASHVDEFKQKNSIVKCRETNDLHHARDAYLNVVVGNVYDTKFNGGGDKYRGESSWNEYDLEKVFRRDVPGAWKKDESMTLVKNTVAKTTMCVTRYALTNKGRFYDEQPLGRKEKFSMPKKEKFPYKEKDSKGQFKYGGYSKVQNAFFTIIEYTDKKRRKKALFGVPVIHVYKHGEDIDMLKKYFEEEYNLKDVRILVPKIKKGALIQYKGTKAYLVGASDGRILFSSALQWYSNSTTDKYIKGIEKLLDWENKKYLEGKEAEEKYLINTNRYKEEKLAIDRRGNAERLNEIIEFLEKCCLDGISAFTTLYSVLKEKRTEFDKATVLKQASALLNIIKYLRRGDSNGLDLSLFGEKKNSCTLKVGKDITDIKFAIIHQSPCGLTKRIQEI